MSILVKSSDIMTEIVEVDGKETILTPYQRKVLELLERIANK